VALANAGTRSSAGGSWVGNIMGKLLNVGGGIASKFGGGWGKLIGTGMSLAGNALGNTGTRSDSMSGMANTALNAAGRAFF
jgi:hypothetical protein